MPACAHGDGHPGVELERKTLSLAGPTALTTTPMRLIALLCAVVFAAGSVVVAVQPVAAQDINARIASIRSSQAVAQRTMRQLDSEIGRYQALRKAAVKERKQAERERNAIKSTLATANSVLAERQSRFARVESQYASPSEAPAPEIYKQRLNALRKEIRVAEARKRSIISRIQAATRVVRARKSAVINIDRRRKSAISRLAGAEGSLSYLIKQMTAIAAVKAEQQATVELSASSSAFSWPTTGRITQGYGCSSFKLYAKRNGCHWHDGIDVASGSGTPVRAVAVGVVAYSGWNPYDKEGRAYVVHVIHPDGFSSIYGHLLPTNHVRAGELVHTGQVIGKMGNTGFSTGTHLHFELRRNGKDVNPADFLPTGIVVVDKTTTRAGQAQKGRTSRAAKATPTPKPTPRPKPSKTLKYATATWEEYEAFELCPDKPKGAECDPKALLARLNGSASGAPGVPKPYRATSPASS